MNHPSFLVLDRIALGNEPNDWRAHVDSCAECREYVAHKKTPTAIPDWLPKDFATAKSRKSPARFYSAFAIAAAACAVFALVQTRHSNSDTLIEKGAPTISLFVKRGASVRKWDGASTVRADDSVRLEIRPAGYSHISVAEIGADGTPTVLYQGELSSSGKTALPVSWRIDAIGDAENLSVVLDHTPPSVGSHRATKSGQWSTTLSLKKEHQ